MFIPCLILVFVADSSQLLKQGDPVAQELVNSLQVLEVTAGAMSQDLIPLVWTHSHIIHSRTSSITTWRVAVFLLVSCYLLICSWWSSCLSCASVCSIHTQPYVIWLRAVWVCSARSLLWRPWMCSWNMCFPGWVLLMTTPSRREPSKPWLVSSACHKWNSSSFLV